MNKVRLEFEKYADRRHYILIVYANVMSGDFTAAIKEGIEGFLVESKKRYDGYIAFIGSDDTEYCLDISEDGERKLMELLVEARIERNCKPPEEYGDD